MPELQCGIFTLLPIPPGSNPETEASGATPDASHAATIINGMRPRMIGRALGIGVRVAGRIAGQRIAQQGQSRAGQPQPQAARAGGAVHMGGFAGKTPGPLAPRAKASISQGVGGFFRPFRRVGSILWLEVTGVFFLLPVIVFGPALWRSAAEYPHTTDHRTFWVTTLIVAVFLYLSVSSFWRAQRRSRRS